MPVLKRKKAEKSELIKKGIIFGLLELVFICLVACFFIVSESLFPVDSGSVIFGIIAVLSLLVISAGVSSALVLGWPFYFFTQKKYKEGVTILVSTLLTMLIIFVIVVLGEIFIF